MNIPSFESILSQYKFLKSIFEETTIILKKMAPEVTLVSDECNDDSYVSYFSHQAEYRFFDIIYTTNLYDWRCKQELSKKETDDTTDKNMFKFISINQNQCVPAFELKKSIEKYQPGDESDRIICKNNMSLIFQLEPYLSSRIPQIIVCDSVIVSLGTIEFNQSRFSMHNTDLVLFDASKWYIPRWLQIVSHFTSANNGISVPNLGINKETAVEFSEYVENDIF